MNELRRDQRRSENQDDPQSSVEDVRSAGTDQEGASDSVTVTSAASAAATWDGDDWSFSSWGAGL
ncbi:hypothetical protein [Halomarina litorea]|uniref:hypothetical protein n=1 Tax=Halomarina litorea TaxID=2961595 RepID=UPI0020C43AE8|nr:hypothetical protein [Halomarina sp. BCD28]